MSFVPVYTSRINWENYPSVNTPLGQVNLNKMDYALYKHDEAISILDTIKANQSDLIQSLKSVTYDTTTGVFVFTYWNNTTVTVDLNIEKIPVSFSMSNTGVITMVTQDGTTYTADLSNMIRVYNYINSDTIRFTITVAGDGTTSVTANIIDGSITSQKLQPNYLADITAQADIASQSAISAEADATSAETDAVLAQSYAVGGTGTRPGEDTDNAKYYKEQARQIVGATGHTIVDSNGTVYTNRASLQFENSQITDDSTNDITKVSLGMIITDTEWTQIQTILNS